MCLCLMVIQVKSQTYSKRYCRKHPVWIDMIKKPDVNYFEAIRAYDLFWEKHPKPKEEYDILGQEKGQDENKDTRDAGERTRESRKEKEMYRKYGLEVKKFEHWKRQVLPYVQSDGRILSKEEQLKLWEEGRK